MDKEEKITTKEVLVTAGLIVVFGLIWSRWPSIKVSSKTLESYGKASGTEQSWTNGIGMTIKASYLDDSSTIEPDIRQYKAIFQKYIVFQVSVSIDGATYPTMIDIPYERTKLTGEGGVELCPINQDLAEFGDDLKLRQLLETFDWSIVNNTFTRQPRFEKGLLLFDRSKWKGGPMTLDLDLYHHPYKRINVVFHFEGPKSE